MKKKLAAASIALALVLGACSGKTDDNENNPADGEETPGTGSIDHGPDGENTIFSMSEGQIDEPEDMPEEEKEKILAAFERYIEMLNEEDIEGYLGMLSSEVYDLDEERKMVESMFETSTIRRETENETIIKYTKDKASLLARITADVIDKKSGEEGTAVATQVTIFQKEEGSWKVYHIRLNDSKNE